MLATAAASYLETLNPEQRRAVQHGVTADDQEGSSDVAIGGDTVLDGSTLLWIERFEI